jgi:hypothetical protein
MGSVVPVKGRENWQVGSAVHIHRQITMKQKTNPFNKGRGLLDGVERTSITDGGEGCKLDDGDLVDCGADII